MQQKPARGRSAASESRGYTTDVGLVLADSIRHGHAPHATVPFGAHTPDAPHVYPTPAAAPTTPTSPQHDAANSRLAPTPVPT